MNDLQLVSLPVRGIASCCSARLAHQLYKPSTKPHTLQYRLCDSLIAVPCAHCILLLCCWPYAFSILAVHHCPEDQGVVPSVDFLHLPSLRARPRCPAMHQETRSRGWC